MMPIRSPSRGPHEAKSLYTNIGYPISENRYVARLETPRSTRTTTLDSSNPSTFPKERGRDNGRNRRNDSRMVETFARLRLPTARRNGHRRTNQKDGRWTL